ncbi:MAG: hypothetical protein IAF02_24760, partial [Anaerolineae bacterium]|nr:hypothetical protein [Anaerolineae bacterium]
AGIVGIGLIALFTVLYQVWAAPPGSPEPTATVEMAVGITEMPETDIPPSETPALSSPEAPPTAVSDSLIVRDWDSNAIWQAGDEINRIPENGEIPLVSLPILIQANDSPMELLLPDRTRLVLDSNTSISLDTVEKGQETAVTLEKGRLGIEPVGLSVAITAPTDVQAHISAGLMGVTYDPELETFDIDCLKGVCELDMPGEDNTVFLSGGEKRRAAQGYILESEAAQFEAFLQLFNRLPTTTPVPLPTATEIGTATATATWTPLPPRNGDAPYEFVIGQSVTGKNLNVLQFGEGPRKFILVGGTHSGYAPNTVNLAKEFIAYYSENLEAIPADVTLFIIPNLNPDAPYAPADITGRLNANGVDLNRNWDCRWTADPIVLGGPVSGAGGTAIESEPEVQALANFIKQQSPTAVIQLAAHGRSYGTASPGSCVESSRVSVALSKLYGNAAGYLFPDADNDGLVEPDARLTGDMSNWLDSIDIPAISVLLSRYDDIDFEANLAGLTAVLEAFTGPDIEAAFTPPVVTDEICTETAVISEAVYQNHQEKLGCAQSNIKQPSAAVQQFDKGTMIWREDTDDIYLLYDNGSLDAYIVKEASDYGATELLKGGFGYVWHTKPGVSGRMGEPKEPEYVANQFKVQDFENGSILTYDGARGYRVLFHNSNKWESDS